MPGKTDESWMLKTWITIEEKLREIYKAKELTITQYGKKMSQDNQGWEKYYFIITRGISLEIPKKAVKRSRTIDDAFMALSEIEYVMFSKNIIYVLIYNFNVCFDRKHQRNQGVFEILVFEIFSNIISNPSQLTKYGVFNLEEVEDKLSNCKPALDSLFISGFGCEYHQKGLRSKVQVTIVWCNTEENMEQLRTIHSTLSLDSEQMDKFMCLISEGYTNQDAMNAITLSEYE